MSLIQHLDDFLTIKASDSIAGKERSQMSKNKYFLTVVKKIEKLTQKPSEWLYEFEVGLPETLKTLDTQQKQDLINYLKDLDFQEFCWFMGVLCRMLTYFNQNNEVDTPFAQVILANYSYLKSEVLPDTYPQETKEFHKRIHKNKEHEENKPKCPKCGSDKLVKNGLSYFCKSCGKQTRKNLV